MVLGVNGRTSYKISFKRKSQRNYKRILAKGALKFEVMQVD